MRKIYLFMLMFCGLFLCGQAAQAQTSYVLSNATYQSSSTDGQTYNFKNGFSVSNAKNKAYQYVKETDYVKYSATTYTINIPDGISISKITFEGYNNTNQADSYFKKINGTEYDASTYVFPKKEDDFIHKSYTIDLSDAPATGSLAFQISGKQCCLIITLETPTSTNIQKVVVNSEASKAHKYLDKGQVVIEKAGKKYSTAGQQLK